MRLRNNSNAINELRESGYLVESFPLEVNKDTIIELGMGKGEMITKLASQNPKLFYVGIEKYATVAAKAMKRAQNLNLKNFKIICEDIKDLPELIKGKVKTIWLTFSDPWPKARHYKRRLTYKDFLEKYKSIMSEEGILRFKTDNDKLFEWTIESLKEFGSNIIFITRDLHNSKVNDNVTTGYEDKWSNKGKNINYLEVKL